MKKLTRRVFVLACAAVLTVSSIPISAEELGGVSENADMSELGAAAGADSLPIDEDVLREHLCPLGGESDIQAVSGITIPASYDLTTSAYFPEKIAVDYALSTPQACVYYQYTYEVNRILGNLSDSDSTVYSPNWVGNSLSCSPFQSKYSADMCYKFLKEHGALHISDDTSSSTAISPTDETKMIEAMKMRLRNWTAYIAPTSGMSRTSSEIIALKTKLYLGYLPRVDMTYYNHTKSTSYGDVIVLGIHKPGLACFSGIIVGYDDNIAVDINGDGVISDCERGAFRVIGGPGNSNGIWVMYDALNQHSEISGDWDSELAQYHRAARWSIFTNETGEGNCFYVISVREHVNDVMVRVRFNNTSHSVPSVTIVKTPGTDEEPYIEYPTTQDGQNGLSHTENFTLLYDLSTAGLNRSNISGSYYAYGVDIRNGGTVDSVTFIDDLGEIVKTPGQDEYDAYISTLGIPLGDLNYSGSVTTLDIVRLNNYLGGRREFSSLQKYLADTDSDGDIDQDDVQAMMRIIAAG